MYLFIYSMDILAFNYYVSLYPNKEGNEFYHPSNLSARSVTSLWNDNILSTGGSERHAKEAAILSHVYQPG